MKKYLADILLLGFFFLLVLIYFYPTILQGKLPVPSDSLVGLYHPWRDFYSKDYPRGLPFKNFLITDPVRQQIPWRKLVIDQWKSRKFPIWNPYNFSGTPLAANIQAAAFYPLNLFFFVFSFPVAWTILIIVGPILGGFFLYLYLRVLKIDPLVALFGSLIWSFSGFNVSWMTWGTITHVSLWLPIMLLAIEKIFTSKDRARTLIWSVLLVISAVFAFFAGHAQVALYLYVVSFIYVFWKMAAKFQPKKLIILGLCLMFFILITSIQWLPLFNLLHTSGRIVQDDYLKAGWFLPWQNLAQFIAPDFFGSPATLNYWGIWNYGEFIGYSGIISLIFIFYALFSNRSHQINFWLLIALASLVLMLPSPFSYLPYALKLPLISSLQPTRLMVVLDFSLAMLSVYGLSAWLQERNKNRNLVSALAIVFIFLAGLWLVTLEAKVFIRNTELLKNLLVSRNNLILPTIVLLISVLTFASRLVFKKIDRRTILVILFAVTAFDLFRFGWKFTPFTDMKYFFPETPVIKFLESQPGIFRTMSINKEILPPNTASYFNLESVEGYDPIFSERYEEFMAASERGKPDINPPFGFNRIITLQNLDSPLLPLLNAWYVLSLTDLNRPYLQKVFQEGEIKIYNDSRSLPRAFFINELVTEKTKERIIRKMFDPLFDPKKFAVVEDALAIVRSEQVGLVNVNSYEGDSLELLTQTKTTQYLVVGNSFDKCWRASVDGESTRIYRTDYILQGLVIPPGSHKIELRCRALLWKN